MLQGGFQLPAWRSPDAATDASLREVIRPGSPISTICTNRAPSGWYRTSPCQLHVDGSGSQQWYKGGAPLQGGFALQRHLHVNDSSGQQWHKGRATLQGGSVTCMSTAAAASSGTRAERPSCAADTASSTRLCGSHAAQHSSDTTAAASPSAIHPSSHPASHPPLHISCSSPSSIDLVVEAHGPPNLQTVVCISMSWTSLLCDGHQTLRSDMRQHCMLFTPPHQPTLAVPFVDYSDI